MLEKAALAHIVIGFAQRRPSLVRVAEKILEAGQVRACDACSQPSPALVDSSALQGH
jgi:hypothetical protein